MPFDSYRALLEGIDEIISAKRDLGTLARGRRLARSYWEIGDAIHTHLLASEGKTAHGEGFFKRISGDLNLDKTLVYLMLRFRRDMPNVETFLHLTWSHYVQIIPLKSQKQREFYERAASHESWTVRELKARIKNDLFDEARQIGSAAYRSQEETTASPFSPRKGQLYTYRLIPSLPEQTAAGELVVDLGFNNHWTGPIEGIENPKPGMIVTAEKHARGARSAYRFSVNRHRGRKLYTVKAVCERVIDGDTLLARIDQGFEMWHTERLRLRGIDTPELYSTAGQRARDYVTAAMEKVPFIVICTNSRDKYGRYLTDLYYLPGSSDPAEVLSDGCFLNRQLFDEGLARTYDA